MPAPLAPSRWLSRPRPEPAAPLRLWCFPYAGAGAAAWHPWAAPLAGVADLVAIRLPGRESRLMETPATRLGPLADALAAEIAPYSHEPYALCGHSLGALLAYETARRLRSAGHPAPIALIASGARAPHCVRTEPDLHGLPDDAFIGEVDRRYQGIPKELLANREFLELFLPALRGDLAVFETYRHEADAPLVHPLLALGGTEDPRVSADQTLAWREHTSGPFEAEFFPGGHFFTQSSLPAVTARVVTFLRRFGPVA